MGLARRELKLTDLVRMLKRRGVEVSYSTMGNYLSGRTSQFRNAEVFLEIEKIFSEIPPFQKIEK